MGTWKQVPKPVGSHLWTALALTTQLLLDDKFVPNVSKLADSVSFIWALHKALLENKDLSKSLLECLRYPEPGGFEIDNENMLYSLKKFLATGNAAQHVYHRIHDNHNERYPVSQCCHMTSPQMNVWMEWDLTLAWLTLAHSWNLRFASSVQPHVIIKWF